jgi:hypothetical protein
MMISYRLASASSSAVYGDFLLMSFIPRRHGCKYDLQAIASFLDRLAHLLLLVVLRVVARLTVENDGDFYVFFESIDRMVSVSSISQSFKPRIS